MRFKLNRQLGLLLAFGCFTMFVVAGAHAVEPANTGAAAGAGAGAAAPAPQNAQRPALALPAGSAVTKEAADTAKVSDSLETATEDALKKDVGMSGILTCFVEQDRGRLKEIEKIDPAQLNAQAEQLSKAWKEKYKEEFAFQPSKVFTNIEVVQGEIQDPQQFLQNWPAPTVGGPQGEAQQAAAKIQTLDDDTRKNGFIDKGRDIAIVRIPAEGNLPALDVSLVNEPHGWKIDVPNSRTAQQIHDDLETRLAILASDPAKWPADPNEARRAFVRNVIIALYGVETQPAPTVTQ